MAVNKRRDAGGDAARENEGWKMGKKRCGREETTRSDKQGGSGSS
jgi:hypothetical protein